MSVTVRERYLAIFFSLAVHSAVSSDAEIVKVFLAGMAVASLSLRDIVPHINL